MYDKITALYCRYSRDDGLETENASITHQRELLKEYADTNGFTNCRFYADDGYSGTNFDRPDFQRMMEDVENGLISTIIVKDMSRFGRNYILVGQYVELVLPQNNVRVIGVTDNYDSYNAENDLFAFESIFAEMYAADISRKVRYAKHTLGMNGVNLKSRPIYGYREVDGNYNEWEIDEEATTVVRMIFDMFLNQDMSVNAIAKYLRKNKIPTPSAYLGYKYTTVDNTYNWQFSIVKRILKFQEYCGDIVNFKTKKISYKMSKIEHIPKEKQMIFPDRYPAIICRDDFEKAAEKLQTIHLNSFSSSNEMKNDTFFRGKCYCAMCGKRMSRNFCKKVRYNCHTYMLFEKCQSNHITEDELRRIVLDHLRKLYQAIKENKSEIFSKLGLNEIETLNTEIMSAENRVSEINSFLQTIYEKRFQREVSDTEFKNVSESAADEKARLQQEIAELTTKKSLLDKKSLSARKMTDKIESCDFELLTQEICSDLIEKIFIDKPMGQREKNYGKRIVDVYIYGIGNISDLVDVRFKPFSERTREIIPQLLLEKKCYTENVVEILKITKYVLKSALRDENTNFQNIVIDVRKEILIDCIEHGMNVKEIYPILGYPEPSNVYWFSKRFFEMTYSELCKKIRE